MSGYIKHFENGAKNMSFMIEYDSVLIKHNEIWNKITKKISIKCHSMPVYDEKYMNVKVKKINGVVNTNFWGDKVPKEGVHHTCIACISVDSVIKWKKKNYPQVYLEVCKYKIKKIWMSGFINAELESDSSSDSE